MIRDRFVGKRSSSYSLVDIGERYGPSMLRFAPSGRSDQLR